MHTSRLESQHKHFTDKGSVRRFRLKFAPMDILQLFSKYDVSETPHNDQSVLLSLPVVYLDAAA